jgi:hypothetical protein
MKNLTLLDEFLHSAHENDYYKTKGDKDCGAFLIESVIDNSLLCVIASSASGWDHVSISLRDRCPRWEEMEQIKRLFFKDDEIAMQLHVSVSDHINLHPNVLHLWRPHDVQIPMPPKAMV